MSDPKEKILVVDDDESVLFLISRALEREGHQVLGAIDGLQALQILEDSPAFAVLIADLMMPKMDGIELIQRAREKDPYLEIIVITAAGSIQSAITTMRDGKAYDYLLKPFESMQQLVMVVNRAVAHRQLVLERAALQRRAQSESQRLQALVAGVSEAILAASADGTITIANPAAERLLNRAGLVGENAQAVLPPKLLNIIENWRVVAGGRPASLEIQWLQGASLMVSLAPLPDQQPGDSGWAIVMRDITPLKRLERLKTQALSDAIAKIRVPMAEAMNAVVELNLHASQDSRLTYGLVRLTKVWEQIQALGNELMTVVQEEAKRKVRPTEVDLSAALDALKNDPALRMYHTRFETDAPLPRVLTDPQLLHSLMLGLIKRAAIRSSSSGEVRVRAREFMAQVWIEVSDDGPPADDADLLQIIDETMTDAGAGLSSKELLHAGLDFVRARAFLERLDGQLWVGGEGAYGSTVIVCLPVIKTGALEEGVV